MTCPRCGSSNCGRDRDGVKRCCGCGHEWTRSREAEK